MCRLLVVNWCLLLARTLLVQLVRLVQHVQLGRVVQHVQHVQLVQLVHHLWCLTEGVVGLVGGTGLWWVTT